MTDNEAAAMRNAVEDALAALHRASTRPSIADEEIAHAIGRLEPLVDLLKEPKASMEMICSYCADWFNPGDVTVPARAIGSSIDGQTIHAACQEQRDFANGVSDLPAQRDLQEKP
jgi:hypothetical protein